MFYLVILAISILLSWGACFYILFNFDPFKINLFVLSFFYFTLFLALLGTFSVLFLLIHRFFRREEVIGRQIKISLRQAFLFSILIIISLVLLRQKILTWWNFVLLFLAFLALERVICSTNRKSAPNKKPIIEKIE